MLNSQFYRRRSDPGHGNYYYGGHEGYGKRAQPTGGYGYGQNMGYNYEAGGGYTKHGGGGHYGYSISSVGPGTGRGRAPDRNIGRLGGPGEFGGSGYSWSRSAGRNAGEGSRAGAVAARGFPSQERGRGGRGGEGGGYREGPRGGFDGRGRGGDGAFGGRGRGRAGGERGRGGQRGQPVRADARGGRGGRGRGGTGAGDGRVLKESVKFNSVVKFEKLPMEISVQDLKSILKDIGFDPKLVIAEITADENQKVAKVKLVEDGPNVITKTDELVINGNPVKCSILEGEEISKLPVDEKISVPAHSGFYVNLQFVKFAEVPTQEEVEKKFIQAGLEPPKKWRKSGPSSCSMVVTGEEDQKEKIKIALKNLAFGENDVVSVKEVRKKTFAVKVSRREPSVHLTNLPLDCDSKKLSAVIKKTLEFEFGVKSCKDGEAEISYTARAMDLMDKLGGMKIGDNVVKVVGEKEDDNYVVPEDWTELKVKEVLGIEKLVPLEIIVENEKVVLLFKPTKEAMPKIIQDLAKMRSQSGKSVEEEEVKAEEEELKKIESKDDSGEKEEAPQIIDGELVVLATAETSENKVQNQVEEAKVDNAKDVKENSEDV